MVEYLDGPQDGREDGEVARDIVATKEDRPVPHRLLCLGDGNLYGHRLEERLGELGFEGMCLGKMYRILCEMKQEGMLYLSREGGGFGVSQPWYALTEVGEAHLESYAGSLVRYPEEQYTFSLFQDERPGQGRGRG